MYVYVLRKYDVCICMYVYIYVNMYLSIYVFTYACMYSRKYINVKYPTVNCMYVCMYVCMRVRTYPKPQQSVSRHRAANEIAIGCERLLVNLF